MHKQAETYFLTLTNQISELERIHSVVEMLCKDWEIPPQSGISINLAIEEAFTNIINYAYEDHNSHNIEVLFVRIPDKLEITIIDDGRAYDPTQNEDPDTGLPVQERPIGGLGILLIKNLMNGVEYQRKEDKNHLILTKKFS